MKKIITIALLLLSVTSFSQKMKWGAKGQLYISSDQKLNNDGVIVSAKEGGGHWVLQYDKTKGIDVTLFGAVGDGVHDDLAALRACVSYAIANQVDIAMPSGVFRITDRLVVGYLFLGEKDMFNRDFTKATSYNGEAYMNARFAQPISITGGNNTVIWGDFKTKELKSVVYYGLIGGGNSRSRRLQPARHGLNNITIVSQENFKAGNYVYHEEYAGSKQLGLCVPRTPSFLSDGLVIYGMEIGLFGQDLYASNITNMRIKSCNQGAVMLGHNASAMTNISFDRCNTGMYFSGAASTISNIWANSCPIGLQIGGKSTTGLDYGSGNLVISGAYFENDIPGRPNVAQIIIGDDQDINDTEIRGLTIKGMTGTAGVGRTFMILKNVREMTMEGCMLYSAPIIKMFNKTKITELNLTYPLNIINPKKK